MDTSHDKVVLTADERSTVAALERRAGRGGARLRWSLALAPGSGRFRSRRTRDVGTVVLLLVGTAVMIFTFTRWPLVAVGALGVQVVALWFVVSRLATVANVTTWRPSARRTRRH